MNWGFPGRGTGHEKRPRGKRELGDFWKLKEKWLESNDEGK